MTLEEVRVLIVDNLSDTHMKKLMFQLSKESHDFTILECY